MRSGDVNEANMPCRVKLSKPWFEKPNVAARSYSRWMLVRVRIGLSMRKHRHLSKPLPQIEGRSSGSQREQPFKAEMDFGVPVDISFRDIGRKLLRCLQYRMAYLCDMCWLFPPPVNAPIV